MTIKGKFIKDIYRDFKTGFAIFSLYKGTLKDGKWDTCLVKSYETIQYAPKTPLSIEGRQEGDLFVAEHITEYAERSSDIKQYLLAVNCPGIGEKTAEKIALTMPDFFVEIKQPDAAGKLAACGVKDTKLALEVLNRDNSQTELLCFLKSHGGTYHQAMKLFEKHGSQSMEFVQHFPYKAAEEAGLTLDTADSIAAEQDSTSFADDERIDYLIRMTAERVFEQAGNTYMPAGQFIQAVQKISSSVFSEPVPFLAAEAGLVKCTAIRYGDMISSAKIERAEDTIATELKRLCSNTEQEEIDWETVKAIEEENGFPYAPQQKWAFSLATAPGVKILTGGPGTGKTTTVDGLIHYFEKKYIARYGKKPEIKLCAPTGRAAQRIKEQTKRDATTIHQLLNFKPFGDNDVCRGKEDPIDADLIIIDEMSMTDVELFAMFLNAVKTGTTVILVGDVDQLASVGPGNVLHDLIDSHTLPVVMLTDVYRQAADSNIVSNASRINRGDIDLVTGEDFDIICTGSDEETADAVKRQILMYHKGTDKYYAQLLCPTHKGIAGVDVSNTELQKLLNDNSAKFVYGGKKFHIGDKVIMLKNNFSKGYCNGDVGTITAVLEGKKGGVEVKFGDSEIEVTGSSLDDMELSYSMTIHKSQGSEYPVVVVAMTDTSPVMLKRNLLYTAVTRAKKKAIVINERGAMEEAIMAVGNTRITKLQEKVRKIFGGA